MPAIGLAKPIGTRSSRKIDGKFNRSRIKRPIFIIMKMGLFYAQSIESNGLNIFMDY